MTDKKLIQNLLLFPICTEKVILNKELEPFYKVIKLPLEQIKLSQLIDFKY